MLARLFRMLFGVLFALTPTALLFLEYQRTSEVVMWLLVLSLICNGLMVGILTDVQPVTSNKTEG